MYEQNVLLANSDLGIRLKVRDGNTLGCMSENDSDSLNTSFCISSVDLQCP